MAYSSIQTLGMKGTQVLPVRPKALSKRFRNFVFTERREIQAYNGVGKLDWGFGPTGTKAILTGIDVLVMKGDKIGALYTFIDPTASSSV